MMLMMLACRLGYGSLMIVCWLVRTLSRISLLASFCPEALLLAHLAAGDLHDF